MNCSPPDFIFRSGEKLPPAPVPVGLLLPRRPRGLRLGFAKAAVFRGGKLLSTSMEKGSWRTKPEFECAFGHCFQASPRLVLKGGHWCDECERKSRNYGQRAKVEPFLPRSGIPFTTRTSCGSTPKEVSELDVSFQ